ncbi:MAG: PHB depolymerase family esterase [bacterium]|nr:PHB depolymerase family esterase [bacterium]
MNKTPCLWRSLTGPEDKSFRNHPIPDTIVQHRSIHLAAFFLIAAVLDPSHLLAATGTLTAIEDFGSNPGNIRMYIYVPHNIHPNAPLVISLHGCRQDAETYSHAGWMALADRWKFYLVFPEQSRKNNAYRCWNWFQAEDTRRGRGEIASIVQMIRKMKSDYAIDDQRIFVEGLSAGGWMVPVLLAAYPDIFAGGATNAGGPAFCASSERPWWDVFGWWYLYTGGLEAGMCMKGIDRSPRVWGGMVQERGYGLHRGPWPRLSIWHGSADRTVNAANQQELVDQWTRLHGIDTRPDGEDWMSLDGRVIHREHKDREGRTLVETYLVEGMGHGTPIAQEPGGACGDADNYIIDVGICGVRRIGLFWGIIQSGE